MANYPLCTAFGVDLDEVRERMKFLNLSPTESEETSQVRQIIATNIDAIVDEFYENLVNFPEPAKFLADRQTLERLQRSQRQYLLSLGQGLLDLAYYEERLRIGQAHERVGLRQKWYLGAGALFFRIISRHIWQTMTDDAAAAFNCVQTRQKLMTLDISLSVETYHQATTNRLERILAQLTEAQESLQKISRLDGLTQVANRRFLTESLEMEVFRCRRFDHAFTLAMLDIDHFKEVNDTHGHAFGDLCLQRVVTSTRSIIRQADIIGRYGGEEFIVGMVETAAPVARQIADRIRLNIAVAPVQSGSHCTSLTLSIGLAELTADVESVEVLIGRADQALYQAKLAGRNRTCVFLESETPL